MARSELLPEVPERLIITCGQARAADHHSAGLEHGHGPAQPGLPGARRHRAEPLAALPQPTTRPSPTRPTPTRPTPDTSHHRVARAAAGRRRRRRRAGSDEETAAQLGDLRSRWGVHWAAGEGLSCREGRQQENSFQAESPFPCQGKWRQSPRECSWPGACGRETGQEGAPAPAQTLVARGPGGSRGHGAPLSRDVAATFPSSPAPGHSRDRDRDRDGDAPLHSRQGGWQEGSGEGMGWGPSCRRP